MSSQIIGYHLSVSWVIISFSPMFWRNVHHANSARKIPLTAWSNFSIQLLASVFFGAVEGKAKLVRFRLTYYQEQSSKVRISFSSNRKSLLFSPKWQWWLKLVWWIFKNNSIMLMRQRRRGLLYTSTKTFWPFTLLLCNQIFSFQGLREKKNYWNSMDFSLLCLKETGERSHYLLSTSIGVCYCFCFWTLRSIWQTLNSWRSMSFS